MAAQCHFRHEPAVVAFASIDAQHNPVQPGQLLNGIYGHIEWPENLAVVEGNGGLTNARGKVTQITSKHSPIISHRHSRL